MPHVFLEWTLVTECVVSSCGEAAEPAVEAGWWAVTWYRGVGAAAVARVMFGMCMSTSSADTAMFVCCSPRAFVLIV
jgi:hypothetical protein